MELKAISTKRFSFSNVLAVVEGCALLHSFIECRRETQTINVQLYQTNKALLPQLRKL